MRRVCNLMMVLLAMALCVVGCGRKEKEVLQPGGVLSVPVSAPRAGIMLVSIDGLAPEAIGCYGVAEAGTPHLDALAADGVVFAQHISQSPNSVQGNAALLCGMLPEHIEPAPEGAWRIPSMSVTLAELLREHGYATAAFVHGSDLDSARGFAQGFEVFTVRSGDGQFSATVQAALAWAGKQQKPYFLFIHGTMRGASSTMDQALAPLIASVRQQPSADAPIIAVTGICAQRGAAASLRDRTIHVPCIMRFPDTAASGTRVTAQTRSIDLFPTLVAVAGLPVPPFCEGVALTEWFAQPREVELQSVSQVWANNGYVSALRTSTWKAVGEALYDLRRDPAETKDVRGTHQDVWQKMQQELGVMRGGAEDTANLDADTVNRLRTLGYIK